MHEQKIVLKNIDSFEPKDIFECGQCFRWNKQEDNSYTGVFKGNVVNIKKENKNIIIKGLCKGELKKIVEEYFDLKTDYNRIKQTLSKIDKNMEMSTKYGKGIRILNQDLWETIISFIISANNNIPRIKGIIERLSKKYGNEIIWDEKKYYTFPTPKQLEKATIQDFRKLGLGFRDKRVFETTHLILNKKINLQELKENKKTSEVKEKLLTLPGVGQKVADCILLFSELKRWEVFPIDVWVRRVMNEIYIKNPDETKVNKKQIEELAKEKFGNLAGIAQQYLFYYRRTSSQ